MPVLLDGIPSWKRLRTLVVCDGGPLSSEEVGHAIGSFTSYTVSMANEDEPVRFTDFLSLNLMARVLTHVACVFQKEAKLLDLGLEENVPTFVLSDLHGDILQLLHWLNTSGVPPNCNLVFIGDYIDRGTECVEVITLIYLLKLAFPHRIAVLRGNHETMPELAYTPFEKECIRVLAEGFYDLFHASFDEMPLMARLTNKQLKLGQSVLCCHGGISPWLELDSKLLLDLPLGHQEKTTLQFMCFTDILWADPYPVVPIYCNDRQDRYRPNKRGCGVSYGPKALKVCLAKYGCNKLIRGHEFVPGRSGFRDVYPANSHRYGENGLCLNIHSSVLLKDPRLPNQACSVARVLVRPDPKSGSSLDIQALSFKWSTAYNSTPLEREQNLLGFSAKINEVIKEIRPELVKEEEMTWISLNVKGEHFGRSRTLSSGDIVHQIQANGFEFLEDLTGKHKILASAHSIVQIMFTLYQKFLNGNLTPALESQFSDNEMGDKGFNQLYTCLKLMVADTHVDPEEFLEARRVRQASRGINKNPNAFSFNTFVASPAVLEGTFQRSLELVSSPSFAAAKQQDPKMAQRGPHSLQASGPTQPMSPGMVPNQRGFKRSQYFVPDYPNRYGTLPRGNMMRPGMNSLMAGRSSLYVQGMNKHLPIVTSGYKDFQKSDPFGLALEADLMGQKSSSVSSNDIARDPDTRSIDRTDSEASESYVVETESSEVEPEKKISKFKFEKVNLEPEPIRYLKLNRKRSD